MATFTELAPELRLFVPSAPIPLAIHAYKKAFIEFSKKSRAYRHDIPQFPLIADIHTYDLDIPANTFVQNIEWVKAFGEPLLPTSPELLNTEDPSWQTKFSSRPSHYFLQGLSQIRVVYTPSVTDVTTLAVQVSLVPKQAATEIPEEISERYYETLLHGATGYLLQLPDATVSDPQRAATYLMMFKEGIETAQIEAKRENTPKDKVTAYGGL